MIGTRRRQPARAQPTIQWFKDAKHGEPLQMRQARRWHYRSKAPDFAQGKFRSQSPPQLTQTVEVHLKTYTFDNSVARTATTAKYQAGLALQEEHGRLKRINPTHCRENEMRTWSKGKPSQPIQLWNAVQRAKVGNQPVETRAGRLAGSHICLFALNVAGTFGPELRNHLRRNIDRLYMHAALSKMQRVFACAAAEIQNLHARFKEGVGNLPNLRADFRTRENPIVSRGVTIKGLLNAIHLEKNSPTRVRIEITFVIFMSFASLSLGAFLLTCGTLPAFGMPRLRTLPT
jgi:hypothetical protein